MGCTSVIPSGNSCHVYFPIRVSNLEKYQALKLQVETQDRMENSQKSDYNWMLDSSPVKVSHSFY